jgi:hypothetical protein
MEDTKLTLALLLAFSLSGCVLAGKPGLKAKTPAAVKPAGPPAPVVATSPPPPPAPLSTPQTNVQLPDPQPISPEALATTLPTEEPAAPPAPAAAKPPQRRTAAPSTPPAPPVTPEPEREPLQEVVPPNELSKLREETASGIRDARQRIAQVELRPVSRQQRNSIDRIASFIRQADEMDRLGNYRQASELANKALALARELK